MPRFIATLLAALLAADFGEAVADGKEFRVVETMRATETATCLAPDGDALWVGMEGGGMTRVTSGGTQSFGSEDGLPGNRVTDCATHAGELWVATEHGLALWDGQDGFVTVLKGRFLRLAASASSLWAATGSGTAYRIVDDNAYPYHLDLVPLALATSADGRVAAGGVDGRVRVLPEGDAITLGPPVTALEWEGNEIVATTADGTLRVKGNKAEPVNALSASGPSGRQINAKTMWRGARVVATDRGVFRFEKNSWQPIPLGGIPCGERIVALAHFDGALWAGGFDGGVCRLDENGWTRFAGPELLPSDRVNDMAADSEHLYVATLGGLAVLDREGAWRTYTKDQCVDNPWRSCPWHTSVTGVAVDEKTGRAWMADTGSVHRLDEKRWRRYYTKAGITSRNITRIAADADRVAVATSDRGLHYRDSAEFITLDDQNGLADNWIMDLAFATDGALWIGTCTRGVSRYEGGRWTTFTTDDGLVDDYILAVRPAGEYVFVGTLSGLSIVGPDGIDNFSAREGLGGEEVHDILIHGGRVYLATDGGITVLEGGIL
ncbi:MAG: hypothetical protein M5R36_01405 [Deltaproteobacteria bacterium]|nr:hypothetical protein [Deltaproteobacteria bacterium]